VLCRFRLQLAGRADEGHQRQMNVECVFPADVLTELADRLEERQALDVADRSADFDQDDIDVGGHRADAVLDFVGDVRNHLHRAPEVIAAPLFLNHRLINFSSGPVMVPRRFRVGEPFVMAEVEVGLGAIIGDVHLTVLIRAHRPRVDIYIRIELLQRHAIPVTFEQCADRRGREPLA
jgi:hypothetical protein